MSWHIVSGEGEHLWRQWRKSDIWSLKKDVFEANVVVASSHVLFLSAGLGQDRPSGLKGRKTSEQLGFTELFMEGTDDSLHRQTSLNWFSPPG